MIKKLISLPVLVITAIALAGCSNQIAKNSDQQTPSETTNTIEEQTVSKETDSPIITSYSEENFNQLFGKEKFALYFSANWCPTCVATKNAIQKTPEKFAGVKLLDVNYDTETALKQKYGITLQHSFVFFNSDGSIAETLTMPTDEEMIAFFTNNDLSAQVKEQTNAAVNTEAGPQYQDYSEEKYNELLGEKPFVIFFHAGWCPSCVQTDKAIKQDLASATSKLPNGTVIIKADYDTEIELKKTYGIVMQSTHVVIDKQGNMIEKLAEPSIDELAQKITTLL